jgi:hypothetical protein
MGKHEDMLINTFNDFITELKDGIFTQPEEKKTLNDIKKKFGEVPPYIVAHLIRKFTIPHAKQIEDRDDNFFLSSKSLFKHLPAEKVEIMTNVLRDPKRTTEDDKETIFQYWELMGTISSKIPPPPENDPFVQLLEVYNP